MEKYGDVSRMGDFDSSREFCGFTTSDCDDLLDGRFDEHKKTFVERMGNGNYSFLCSEDAFDWEKFSDVMLHELVDTQSNHKCPIFCVDCLYVKLDGAKHPIQISHCDNIYALLWNDVDLDVVTSWYTQEQKL